MHNLSFKNGEKWIKWRKLENDKYRTTGRHVDRRAWMREMSGKEKKKRSGICKENKTSKRERRLRMGGRNEKR